MKVHRTFRLDERVDDLLSEAVKATRRDRTEIVEDALKRTLRKS